MTKLQCVTLERTYPASAEQIWRAWTDPEILSRWYGCQPDQLWTIHEWDVRTGGALRVSMEFDTGPFEITGEFLVVAAPNSLRFTFGDDQTITVTITEQGDQTTVTVDHDGLPTDEMCDIVTAGWTSSLSHLGTAAAYAG